MRPSKASALHLPRPRLWKRPGPRAAVLPLHGDDVPVPSVLSIVARAILVPGPRDAPFGPYAQSVRREIAALYPWPYTCPTCGARWWKVPELERRPTTDHGPLGLRVRWKRYPKGERRQSKSITCCAFQKGRV